MDQEDDIDLETLQARIDQSMVFTDNLVSSWLQSSKGRLAPSRSHREDEKMLEEHMRRPPRLGVGAAIPASSSVLSRDTARLKYKLVATNGKKRLREDDHAPAVESDDEDESRARAITKKAKRDPFGESVSNKKKKKKQVDTVDVSKTPNEPSGSTLSKMKSAAEHDDDAHSSSHEQGNDALSGAELKSITKKKHKKPKLVESSGSPLIGFVAPSPTLSTSASPPKNAVQSHSVRGDLNKSGSASIAQLQSNSLPSTTLPLLNLGGPLSFVSDGSDTSPKKKRKRRKKKKAHVGASD